MAVNVGKGLIVSINVSLTEAPGFLKAPGGAPANVVVSKLSRKSTFIGKLGDDEFGHMLVGILKENDISADGVTFDKSAHMALALVTLRADDKREFMFYGNSSADMLLTPDELNLGVIKSANIFHYESISLIVDPCRLANLKVMDEAESEGALLSYDPNLRLPLWPSAAYAKVQIMTIWENADIIKVSDVELDFLTGSNKIDNESAMSLWQPKLQLLLVTLGDKGCRYYNKNFLGSIGGFPVKTVGKVEGGVKYACTCGVITTTKNGAIPALPQHLKSLQRIKKKKENKTWSSL